MKTYDLVAREDDTVLVTFTANEVDAQLILDQFAHSSNYEEEFELIEADQDYIVVDGGIVENNPGLPVFELDVLDPECFILSDVAEVIDLYTRIAIHPKASKDLTSVLDEAATIVRGWGAPEDVEYIDKLEDKRKEQKS